MKPLTPKQEKFAQLYIELGNASEAYRQAYPGSQKWKDLSVHVKASRLLARANVQLRLEKIRDDLSKKSMVTLDDHLEQLRIIRQAALESGKLNAAVSAEVSRGKVCGLYTERVDVTTNVKPFVVVRRK